MSRSPPTQAALLPNFPNPFSPATRIPFQLDAAAAGVVVVYDGSGRTAHTLRLGADSPGYHHSRASAAYWDGRNGRGDPMATGICYVESRAGDFRTSRKVLLAKWATRLRLAMPASFG